MVCPEAMLGNRRLRYARIVALLMCFFAFVGCGSKNAVVKSDLGSGPSMANAISKALTFGTDKSKAVSEKDPSFPNIAFDESTPGVKKFIREYAYGRRETMKQYMAQAERFLPMVKGMAKDSGLPEEVAYLFMLESGANPEARSPANALGMWQFMPATARSYGLRVDSWVDERLDPKKSTKAALVYLKDLYGMFGCWRLALSAYNSGENKLNRVLCQEDASEYEEICSSSRLKRETREFYPRFQAIAQIAKEPEKYGFAAISERKAENKQENLTVNGSFSLKTLAQAMNISQDALEELNPDLVRGATPSDSSYTLRVPLGKKQIVEAKLKEIPCDTPQRHIVHVVGRGDSLTRILKRYGVRKSQLAVLNPDVNFGRRLRQGEKILVPAEVTHTKKSQPKGKRLSAL